jgi:[NiFe] hydrogenase diaphorase moiety small subunit
VHIGGRPAAACSTPAEAGLVIENRSAALDAYRRALLQMLFVGGEHFCPGCEVSGSCMLQATAYALGMEGPRFPPVYTHRPLDGSHPDILLDPNRCMLCELCVRASRDVDGKHVFAIGGHGADAHLLVNAASGRLGDTAFDLRDRAAGVCPVGAILPKRRGFAIPIGDRRFDAVPIDARARPGSGDGAPAGGGRA